MSSRQTVLVSESISAAKASYLGTLIRVCSQFGAQILIMRAIGPDLMGSFVYVLLAHTLLTLVIDQGLGWSIIKSGTVSADEIATLFARCLVVSFVCLLLVFALSYPVEQFAGDANAGWALRYSAPICMITGIYIVSNGILRLQMRYKEIQMALIVSYLAAYPVVGLFLALHGYGIWSLLAALYVQTALQAGILYFYCRHGLRLRNPFASTKSGRLGWQVTGINVVNWVVDNCGGVLVSVSGPFNLGNFNAASVFARTPVVYLVLTLQTIVFSAVSAYQNDLAKVKGILLGLVALIAYLVFPAYGYVSTHAPFVVSLIFGEKWHAASGALSSLSVGMMALAVSTLSGAVLTATGAQKNVLHSQALCLGMMCTGIYAANGHGLFYVGAAVSFAYTAGLLMQMRALSRKIGIRAAELFGALRGPVILAVIMAVPVGLTSASGVEQLPLQALLFLIKAILGIQAIRWFPRLFLGGALETVLNRFGIGKRLIEALR